MKLVIEIDEVRFKDIQRIAEVQLERNHFQTAEQIIANGTPLPSVEPERQSGKVVFKHRHHHNVNHYTGEDADGEIHKISVLEDYEVDEPYCSECGKRIDDIQGRFCVHCGVRLEEEYE